MKSVAYALVSVFIVFANVQAELADTAGEASASCPACDCTISKLKEKKITCAKLTELKNNTNARIANAAKKIIEAVDCQVENGKVCPDTHYEAAPGICAPK